MHSNDSLPSDSTVILNKEQRIVATWGSVGIKDDEGQILLMEDVIKSARAAEERNGGYVPIHYDRKGGHSNKSVGRTIDQIPWRIEKDGKSIPGVIVVYKINKGYRLDEAAWKDIEKGVATGLSFGGESYDGDYKCNIDDPYNCAEVLKDFELHEWTLARKAVNPLSTHITKSQFRKIVDELTVAGYDTGKVVNIAKSFLTIEEEDTSMDDETKQKIDEIVKAVEVFKELPEKVEALSKDVADLKKAYDDKGKMCSECKKNPCTCKKEVKKEEEPTSELDNMPKPVTKEDMEEILKKTFDDTFDAAVQQEVKKQLEGTKTAQTDMPGTGNATDLKKDDDEAPAKLEDPNITVDPKDVLKDAGKPKSTMPHPSKGIQKFD